MLDAIAKKFMDAGLVASTWRDDVQCRGELVCLYREYYEGDHRMKLTKEMKSMMQISDDRLDRYNDNYCEMVVNSMADRLTVDHIGAMSKQASSDPKQVDPAQMWVDVLMDANRFDGLQIDVREAALRDGETFVMLEYDEESKQVEMYHELAWDGSCGVMVVMDNKYQTILAAAKVWYEGDTTRVNLYYPNLIEKYTAGTADDGATELTPITDPEDTTRSGKMPGVPIVRFSRKKKPRSELKNVIPLQDSLNRTVVDMVMSAELTAFSVMFAKGWKPPQAITPGMIYHAMITNADGTPVVPQNEDEAKALVAMIQAFSLQRIEGGSLAELVKQAEFIISQIEKVSSTPVDLGGGQSGEYLKQLDVRLQGKIESAQVTFGNSWEDVIRMAALMQLLFGHTKPPELAKVSTEWKSAEIRNDADIFALFKLLNDAGYTRAALRALSKSPLANFTEKDIDKMVDEKSADTAKTLQRASGTLDGFGQFNPPGQLNFNSIAN